MNGLRPSALFVPEYKELLEKKSYQELKQILDDANPMDLADGWTDFSPMEQMVLFKLLSTERAMEVFEDARNQMASEK